MNPFPCRYCGATIRTDAEVTQHMRQLCRPSVTPRATLPDTPEPGSFAPAPPPLPIDPASAVAMEQEQRAQRRRLPWSYRWRVIVHEWLWIANEYRYSYRLIDWLRLEFEKAISQFNLWQHSDAVHVNDVERELDAFKKRLEFYEQTVPALRRAKAAFDLQQPPKIAPDGVFTTAEIAPVQAALDARPDRLKGE